MSSSNASARPIRPGRLWYTRSHSSRLSDTPVAEAAIAKDLEEEPDNDPENPIEDEWSGDESDSDESTVRAGTEGNSLGVSMVGSYRRPSFTAAGSRPTAVIRPHSSNRNPTKAERHEAWKEERNLLRDNNIISSKHPQEGEGSKSRVHRVSQHFVSAGVVRPEEGGLGGQLDGSGSAASDTTPLLGNPELPHGSQHTHGNLDKAWEEAVMAGKIKTTWRRETKVLARYSSPLVLTFLLQYSLTVASIFSVGHLGKVELGAVSLGSMTANITGYAVYQGLATSLDTLCAQAYGSGRKKLVGLQTQRMIYFLWCITIPIGIVWLSAEAILIRIVPEAEVAVLAGRYLKILLIGTPGYTCFESGKKYLQAQGLFSASLYILLICAPLNAVMNWLFVWKFKWGFIGAPIAVAVTDCLLPLFLVLYVRFIGGRGCWPGFTKRALSNWGPMIRLALPGLFMVEAECFAFEMLTLASSYFGTTHLAAQSVLATITSLTWQIPFPISIAASTRIANFIGATLADAAKTNAKVAAFAAGAVGIFNVVLLSSLRNYIPQLFTSDPDVIALVAGVLPLCAAFQFFDAVVATLNGILRGLGRQAVGGWVQLFCYYVIGMPVAMTTAFKLHWELYGLWSGVALALLLVMITEAIIIYRISWERSVEDAKRRNASS